MWLANTEEKEKPDFFCCSPNIFIPEPSVAPDAPTVVFLKSMGKPECPPPRSECFKWVEKEIHLSARSFSVTSNLITLMIHKGKVQRKQSTLSFVAIYYRCENEPSPFCFTRISVRSYRFVVNWIVRVTVKAVNYHSNVIICIHVSQTVAQHYACLSCTAVIWSITNYHGNTCRVLWWPCSSCNYHEHSSSHPFWIKPLL